jgi:alkylhydroperoxidase family enzyme
VREDLKASATRPPRRLCHHPPMPHIRLIEPDEADGLLAEEYDAAVQRAGKVFHILKAMSLNPPVLKASMELYKAIMFGESGLSRRERELLATVTSAEQFCRY